MSCLNIGPLCKTNCGLYGMCPESIGYEKGKEDALNEWLNGFDGKPTLTDLYNVPYQQGRQDAWSEIENIINSNTNPIQTMELLIKQIKEQNE